MEMDISTTMMNRITLAYVLKKYRAQSGLTLEQVSAKISFSQSLIRNLEEGVYSKSHVSETAEVLKRLCYLYHLQYSEVERLFLQEASPNGRTRGSTRRHRSINRAFQNMSITDRTLRVGLLGGGVLMIVGYVAFQSYTFVRAPRVHLDQFADFEYTSDQEVVIAGRVDTGGNLTLNGESVTLESDGRFSIDVPLTSGENPLEFQIQRGEGTPSVVQKIVYLK